MGRHRCAAPGRARPPGGRVRRDAGARPGRRHRPWRHGSDPGRDARSAAVERAGVAGVLVAIGWLGSRAVSRWHLLACGAALVLALNPLELFDPGFQLSFSAVLAIFLVAPRLRGALGSAAAVSVACTVVTAPIVWWHFGRASPLAVPANLLALPAVAPILWLSLAAVVAHAVWA